VEFITNQHSIDRFQIVRLRPIGSILFRPRAARVRALNYHQFAIELMTQKAIDILSTTS
jgi:hypothetical protein